jgi:argininosuccinate synthase
MKNNKVILAYSGGLDTSVILKWLIGKGYQVICFYGNLGQKDDLAKVKKKALKLGASKVYIVDLKKEFIEGYIYKALAAGAIYEGKYLLGTALARPLLAKAQIKLALKEEASYVSHGSTGKGNDQVRFELGYLALNPKIKILSPWKDKEFLKTFKGRTDLIGYAKKHGIPISASKKKPYSEDENIMHISHEAGILEDPSKPAPSHVCSLTNSPKNAPDKETKIKIHFKQGIPVKVESKNKVVTGSLSIYSYLNKLGSINGIGRLDMVENRFIGIKSRGIYETPAAYILWQAHLDLEGLVQDKEVLHLKQSLMPKFADIIYNGFWFSPEFKLLDSLFQKSNQSVTGSVTLSLYKGNVTVLSRTSPNSLYNKDISSMDIEGGFDATDSKGFIKVNALRLQASSKNI